MCRQVCFSFYLLVCLVVTVTLSQSTTLTELDESGGGSPSSPSLASAATNYDDNYDEEEDGGDDVINVDPKKEAGNVGKPQRTATLSFVKELKNVTKEAGDFLKLKCDVTGSIPASSIQVKSYQTLNVFVEKNLKL